MTLHISPTLIAYGTPTRTEYECSTTGTIVLVHPYTGERKPIANCEANRPTYYAMLKQGWLDDGELSATPPDNTGVAARSQKTKETDSGE